MSGLTDDPNDPRLGHGGDTGPVPQNEVYLVLSEEERKKGFIRPLRRAYTHVGIAGPKYELRDLSEEQQAMFADRLCPYAAYEEYPMDEMPTRGRFWKQSDLDRIAGGCGAVTTMSLALCETYARQPTFYGATYCVACAMHLPVEEFTWVEDGERVGT